MYVKMDCPEDRNLALKWRGAALSQFDGRTWYNPYVQAEIMRPDSAGLLVLESEPKRRADSKHISYAVHMDEMASDALFFAGAPQYLRIDSTVFRNSLDNYRVRFGDTRNVWYQVYSRLESSGHESESADQFAEPLTEEWRRVYLRPPPRLDPRVIALTQRIVGAEKSPAAEARLIENYLRTRYGYTLELPPSEPVDPLAFFLLHRKKGHSEYFTSSIAPILPLDSIPSRAATGFQSGVYTPVSGSQLILRSQARA